MESHSEYAPGGRRSKVFSMRTVPAIALVGVLIMGTAIRLHVARHAVPFGDDYGTAALMSKHILEGREFPLYFYGYQYVGALGSYVGAVMFALFGQSPLSMCVAMLVFAALWIVATYWLFGRLISPWAGLVAAALVAFAPPTIVVYSTIPLIGYPPTFAFGTLLLYLGVRLTDRDLSPRGEGWCLIGMGALAGLAIWTNPLCLPYLVVAFGLLVARAVHWRLTGALVARVVLGLIAFLAALSPAIVTAHRYGVRAMFSNWPWGIQYLPRSVRALVHDYLPDQLFPATALSPGVAAFIGVLYVLLAGGFVAGMIVAVARRHTKAMRAGLVPLAFVAVFLVLFLLNSTTGGFLRRYFTPFYLGPLACVVLPLVFKRRWAAICVAAAAVLLAAFNVAATVRSMAATRQVLVNERAAVYEPLIEQAREAGLRHVMIENYYGQAATFLAREELIFCRTAKERYYPYAVSAAADDNAGFTKRTGGAHVFAQTLEALGIESWETFGAGGWTVFHSIELPEDQLELVEPVAIWLEQPDGARVDAAACIDRNDETIAGAPFASDAVVVVDFGRPVEISAARFVAPAKADFPVGYIFSASLDGRDWHTIQRVDDRDSATCIYGNRLDHEGRFTAMECRFPSTRLRYLQMARLRPAAFYLKVWQLQEAYFYCASEANTGRPDGATAAALVNELNKHDVTLVIADEWLSRKIELMPGPRPDVLPRWEFRFPESHVSRVLPIREGVAVVVEAAHAEQAGARVRDATLGDVRFEQHDFPHYTAYVIDEAPAAYESFPGLRWNGFTLADTARIATADWYHRHAERLEHAGNLDGAARYSRRAFTAFPGIQANLERLAPDDDAARATLDALTPDVPARVRFPHGASLVGYTLAPSPLVAGEPATLRLVWQLEGRVKHNVMQVFVHFRDGTQRLLQADHNAVFPVAPGSTVPRALVLDEHEFMVPPDAPAGELVVYLGATSVADRRVRLKPRTNLPVRGRAVRIGQVGIHTVAPSD